MRAALRQEIMADIFDFWRLMLPMGNPWVPEASSSGEAPARADPGESLATLASALSLRLELATLWLFERHGAAKRASRPVLIVAPYSLHDAAIADFAQGHSLMQRLEHEGVDQLALIYWKSASFEMRDYGIDAYLSDLNVVVDDLGGSAALVGLCQGGWLAAAYAARFPEKVIKLVVAGSPIDLEASPSQITRTIAWMSPAALRRLVEFGGGRVLGDAARAFWVRNSGNEFVAEDALQTEGDDELRARFAAWSLRTVNLPGRYFLETAEWLFRENRLARDRFPALGRICKLRDVKCPLFILAASEDEIVSPPQATALARLCPDAPTTIRIVAGKHLSLFMGRDTLRDVWKEISAWLEAEPETRAPRRRKPGSTRAQSPLPSSEEL